MDVPAKRGPEVLVSTTRPPRERFLWSYVVLPITPNVVERGAPSPAIALGALTTWRYGVRACATGPTLS
jgi:hypothetical protein